MSADIYQNLFVRIEHKPTWVIEKIPQYHPDDPRHTDYWRETKRKCIEGVWGPDFDGFRYMPANLFFYVNFCKILHVEKRTKVRKMIKPWLRDLEWEFAYMCLVARGFSGFMDDEYYSCHESFVNEFIDPVPSCYNSSGELKEYVDPLEYTKRLHSQPLGLPLYENNSKNSMVLGSRGGGKSYWYSLGVNLHEVLFDGAKYYDEESIKNPAEVHVNIGSGATDKSSEFCSKMKAANDCLATDHDLGAWGKIGDDDYTPSIFYKDMTGSLQPNNAKSPWRHEYQVKSAGRWTMHGTGSKVVHTAYKDNAEAGAGGRFTLTTVEEVGLCFGEDTEIRLLRGGVKKVQDIKVGDILMGEDGTMRTVMSTISGEDTMYKVKQTFGDDYIVNSKHPICTKIKKWGKNNKSYTEYKEILAKNFNSEKYLKTTYGYKNSELDFFYRDINLDPYWLGCWIGDEKVNSNTLSINKKEKEMLNYFQDIFKLRGCDLQQYKDKRTGVLTIYPKKRGGKTNYFNDQLRTLNIFNYKSIPEEYLINSKEVRLGLLAGLIDTDGSYIKRNTTHYFEFYQTNRKDLIDQIMFLCTSLGFRVTLKERISNKGYGGKKLSKERIKYTIRISGDIHKIPTKCPRKKAEKRNYKKDFLSTSIKVEEVGKGTYYGFTLKESPYFLLKDGTVVHNTENVIAIHTSNIATTQESTLKFGSQHYLGTAGNMEKIREAKEMFTHPDIYHLVTYDDVWEHSGKIGFFMPATLTNNDFKDENGNTKWEEAEAYYQKRRDDARKARNPRVYEAELMNYPLAPSEMFIGREGKILPVPELKERERELMRGNKFEKTGVPIEIFYDSEHPSQVDYKVLFDIQPIYEFPTPKNADIEGAIMMYERPIVDERTGLVPHDLYNLVGYDPYVSENLDEGESLGAVFVMKNPKYLSMGYGGNEIVASYVGKHSRGTKGFNENVEKLLMMYGSPTGGLWFEADRGKHVKNFFEYKNKQHLLALRPRKQMSVSLLDKRVTDYGFVTGNKINKIQLLDMLADWLKEETEIDGVKKRNLERIPDIALVRELIAFDLEKGNYDRVMALIGCVLGLRELESQMLNKVTTKHNPLQVFVNNRAFKNKRYVKKHRAAI